MNNTLQIINVGIDVALICDLKNKILLESLQSRSTILKQHERLYYILLSSFHRNINLNAWKIINLLISCYHHISYPFTIRKNVIILYALAWFAYGFKGACGFNITWLYLSTCLWFSSEVFTNFKISKALAKLICRFKDLCGSNVACLDFPDLWL